MPCQQRSLTNAHRIRVQTPALPPFYPADVLLHAEQRATLLKSQKLGYFGKLTSGRKPFQATSELWLIGTKLSQQGAR